MKPSTAWPVAAALALLLAASHLLDGPDEIQAAQDTADAAHETALQTRQEARLERIAAEVRP